MISLTCAAPRPATAERFHPGKPWASLLRIHWSVPPGEVPEKWRVRPMSDGTIHAEVRVGMRRPAAGQHLPCAELRVGEKVVAVWGGRTASGWDRAPGGGLERVELAHNPDEVILAGEVRRSGLGFRWKAVLGLFRAYESPVEGTRDAEWREGDPGPAVAVECDILEMDLILEAAPWMAGATCLGAHYQP